jgi:transcriptional regulator with XRE-family HTH domain
MVNSEEFSKRLQIIMEYYEISAATFADAIQVGRSSISHILSGRNKPSLDFVLKIVQTYPEVELYWLLNGKGDFPKSAAKTSKPEKQIEASAPTITSKQLENEDPKDASITEKIFPESNSSTKKIKRVVLFYEDGTFEAFEN